MSKIPLVYILGASHCGSTLLTMLLHSHPELATVGEMAPGGLGDPDSYICSCGTPIRRCTFWQWIAAAARQRGVGFGLEDFGTAFTMPGSRLGERLLCSLHRGPLLELARDCCLRLLTPWPRRFGQVARANEALAALILEHYSARVCIDKGNLALRLKHLLRIQSFDVKVIHLVRDGRALALTYMDPAAFADAADPARRGGGMGARQPRRLSMREAATDVRRCFVEAGHVLARVDANRQITIRYEDLCADTDATLDALLEFIGVDPAGRRRDFRSVEHHVVGNGMRLDSAVGVRLDERWRSALGQDDLQVFDSIAGQANRNQGYS